MIGKVTYPNTEVTGPQVVVPLERLFAKVTIKVKVDIRKANIGYTDDPPSFDISTYILHNLPKKVCLGNALSEDGTVLDESSWVDNEDAFEGPLEGEINKLILDEAIDLNGNLDILPEEVLTFYVPEYALEPEKLNTAQDQKIKPSLCNPDKHPIYVTLNGIISQEEFEDAPVSYNIHLGENPYDSFSLRRNIWYTYNMYINGTVDAFIGTDLRVETEPFNLADPGRTGTDNPANCYIISKPGRYLLPTYIGNNVAGGTISNAEECEIIDINGDAINTISNVDVIQKNGKDYVVFNANVSITDGVASLNDVKGGNKLLAIKDASGKILWSWHLWFCENGRRPDHENLNNVYPTTSAVVMNRALGATNRFGIEQEIIGIGAINLAQWTDGLYYQWGRKDPMMSSGNSIANGCTYEKSVQNPRTFYTDWTGSETESGWSGTKTINDPCPPGYKVPSNAIWRTGSHSSGMENILNAITPFIPNFDGYPYNLEADMDMQVNIVFPYSGYIDQTGVHVAGDLGKIKNVKYATGTGLSELAYPTSGQKRFRNISCKETEINKSGSFWNNNNSEIKYYRRGTTREILDCEYDTAKRTVLGMVISWNNSWKPISAEQLSEDELQAIESNIALREGILNWGAPIDTKIELITPSNSLNNAYQVRCVREDSPIQ